MPLIELDDLIWAMRQEDKRTPGIPWSITGVQRLASQIPTIEATPVVHGRWVCVSIFLSPVSGRGQHKCSNCEDHYTTDAKHIYFCPNCGAKMVEIEHPAQYGPKYDFVDGEWKTVHGLISESFVETRTEADFPNCGAKMDGGVSDG